MKRRAVAAGLGVMLGLGVTGCDEARQASVPAVAPVAPPTQALEPVQVPKPAAAVIITPVPAPVPVVSAPPAPVAVVPPTPALDLADILKDVPADQRIATLTAVARKALAQGRTTEAVAAAKLATTEPKATARELLLLARTLYEDGQVPEASRQLKAAEPGLDAVGDQALFDEFLALEAQLLASFGNVPELARGLEAQASRGDARVLSVTADRIKGGYRLRLTLAGKPQRLIALWSDREELGIIALEGTDHPLLGSHSVDLTWPGEPPRGTVMVFAVNPDISRAPALATRLPTLPVDAPTSESDRRAWRQFIEAVRAHPPAGAAVVRLAPDSRP